MKRFLLLPFTFYLFTCLGFAQTLAPGAPGKDAQWATAGKQGVGTSASLESKVWFTLAQGVMTEVYYPDVTVPNVHLLQFVVVNPKTRKVETEQDDAYHEIKVNPIYRTKDVSPIINLDIYRSFHSPSSLAFTQISRSKGKGKDGINLNGLIVGGTSSTWEITKNYVTDPENNSVVFSVGFRTDDPDNELYVYYDPSLGNSGSGDTAWTQGNSLLAKDGNFASALSCRYCRFTESANGFLGVNDGLTQLRIGGRLENPYRRAENGNVVQVAKITPAFSGGNTKDFRFEMALGFGKDESEASNAAAASLLTRFDRVKGKYQNGWIDYLKSVRKVDPKYQAQFNMAAMILKAHEDKTIRGANVASLTVPWGGGDNANENDSGGYHLIWPRDLYHAATALIALGDKDAAVRALDFLFNVQQKPDGSFPQNSFLDGKPFWGSLQMDEVAFPLILAYQLGKNDKKSYENHVKRAADFIVKNGPSTPQERWEEESGYSPSTIAAEIAGLVCAAEIAKKNGDEISAKLYLKTADEWQANIEKWTATTTGKYGDGNYYLRISQNGRPNAGGKIELNNGAGYFDEREIVDAGFLELVRLGVKSPDDPLIAKSVKVIDEVIRVETPNGDAFYRYNHDGYGEMDDGRRWNFDGKYSGKGRLWALLSGERGQYELAFSEFARKNPKYNSRVTQGEMALPWRHKAMKRLEAMANFAGEGLMIPEQIWDKAEVPKNADKQFVPELKFGEGTGSATPLAWSMAQFVRLAVNLQEGRNLDTPDVVYDRYVLRKKPEVRSQNSEEIRIDDPSDRDISGFEGIDNRCWGDKPLFVKDCSYVSTLAEENSQNPIFRKCRLGGFFIACKDSSKEMHACFNYQGEFKTLEIAGDFTDWKPITLKVMKKTPGIIAPCFNFSKTDRVEYKLIVDGKWITDPLNPNKVEDGVGGENSFFTMPDYKPTNVGR